MPPSGGFFLKILFVITILCVIVWVLQFCSDFLEIVMVLSREDKMMLQRSIQTEIARVRRSMKAAANPSIAEILQNEIGLLQALEGRVFQEKESTK